ncbi:MAG: hypothetical protein ACTHMG_03820 [Sphingomonas sp.]
MLGFPGSDLDERLAEEGPVSIHGTTALHAATAAETALVDCLILLTTQAATATLFSPDLPYCGSTMPMNHGTASAIQRSHKLDHPRRRARR